MRHPGLDADQIFGIYVGLLLIDFMSEHGQRFNGNEQESTPSARGRLLQVLVRTLGDIDI